MPSMGGHSVSARIAKKSSFLSTGAHEYQQQDVPGQRVRRVLEEEGERNAPSSG